VKWPEVYAALFGNRFGVKRLAPGATHEPLGRYRWAFGHDATTLRGSSGSPLVNWFDSTPDAFGLHFQGRAKEANLAHAIARCASDLQAIGVPVVG
jgi:hypothetical protein